MLSTLEARDSVDWASVDIALAQFLCHLKSRYERLFTNVTAKMLESVMDFHTWSWSIKSLTDHVMGESNLTWGLAKTIPAIGEDPVYVIWCWNDCCNY